MQLCYAKDSQVAVRCATGCRGKNVCVLEGIMSDFYQIIRENEESVIAHTHCPKVEVEAFAWLQDRQYTYYTNITFTTQRFDTPV